MARLLRRFCLPLLSLLIGLSGVRSAKASDRVSISTADEGLREFADRLASELASDGYVVHFEQGEKPSPCEGPAASSAATEAAVTAWIRLAPSADRGDVVVATICFRSMVTLLQRVSSQASRSEPKKLALITAEALNGLRAQVPLLSTRPSRELQKRQPATSPPLTEPRREKNALAAAQTLLIDPTDFPLLWGATLTAELASGSGWGLLFDAFFPTSPAELANAQARVQTRIAWVRVGPIARLSAGSTRLVASLLAGPALTWATGQAPPPRLSAADIAVSSMITLGASVEYPSESSVFALGAARLASLLPSVGVAVGSDTSHALGPLLVEASLGIGLRFGGPL